MSYKVIFGYVQCDHDYNGTRAIAYCGAGSEPSSSIRTTSNWLAKHLSTCNVCAQELARLQALPET